MSFDADVSLDMAMLALSGVEIEPDAGIEPLVEACRVTNTHAVELWVPRNVRHENCRSVLARLGDAGIALHCLSAGIELVRDDRGEAGRQQRRLLELIALAATLGVRFVNSYVGFSAIRDDERMIAGYLELVEPCLDRAEAAGVTILIENEFDAFGWDPAGSDLSRRPDSLARLIEASGSAALRTTFDPANWICAGVDPLGEALPRLLPYVSHVHVKNVRSIAADAPPVAGWRAYSDRGRHFSTCGFVEGAVDWAAIVAELDRSGYDGAYCLEPHGAPEGRLDAWSAYAAAMHHELARPTARC